MGDNGKTADSSMSKCLKCSNPAVAGKFWCVEHGCAHPGCTMSGNGKFCPIHKATVDDKVQAPTLPVSNVPPTQEPPTPPAVVVPPKPSPVEPKSPTISVESSTKASPKPTVVCSPPPVPTSAEPTPLNPPPTSPVSNARNGENQKRGKPAAANKRINLSDDYGRVVYNSASKVVVQTGCSIITMPKSYVSSDDDDDENSDEKPIMVDSTRFTGVYKLQVYCSECKKFHPTSALNALKKSGACNNTFASEYVEVE
ncbi:hypothetical protein IWQ62_000742 [Dispira parvispora]|uniref:Uncharacterized protein n=1 Tax=Dispira parvispora TaxID=1520584 RepID=A0A9W8ATT6_9FUNG|nr:hypothetical protein IWQ62_000742 [Dispira parvispora]